MLNMLSQRAGHVLTSLAVGAALGLCPLARADDSARAAPPLPSDTRTEDREPPASTAPSPPSAATPAAPVERPSIVELQPQATAPEPTFRAETRRRVWPNVPLLATGATVLTASYLPAVVGAAISDRHDKLYIPVSGPWLTLSRGPEEKAGHKALLAVDGVAQGLGALVFLSSFLVPERITEHWHLIGRLQMVPGRVGKGVGLSARARF